jgi:type II secretory pathway component GspD/PulD (secretin)
MESAEADSILEKVVRAATLGKSIPFFFLAVLAATVAADAAVEVISLNYRSAAEVLSMVKSMLSPEGKISADERTNSLIIVDSEEAIARVRHSLAFIDKPVRQAMVRVRFQESGQREERSVSGGGRVSGDDWSVSGGRGPRGRDGVDVRAEDRSVSRGGSSEYFINTLSGSWAYIRVGQDIPYTARWSDLCRRYARTVVFQRIETGFDVKPVIRENMADVEIVPRISETGSGGRPGGVRFAEASTQVQVPLGQWVTIGGSGQSVNEVLRAILEAGSSRQASALSIELLVEAR